MLRVEALLSNLEHYFTFLAINLFLFFFNVLIIFLLMVFPKVNISNTIPDLMILEWQLKHFMSG